MHAVRRAGASPATDIVYANPCKAVADIKIAQRAGVPLTVVDSPEEVVKLASGGWKGGVLIRLMVPDAGSAQPFSKKFGAPLSWVPEILHLMRAAPGITHRGWSFHVGSQCGKPSQFRQAIEMCVEAGAETGADTGPMIVDIGGGFVPGESFAAAAAVITDAQRLFPSDTRWIGEPGRFLSSPVCELEVEVIGIKRRMDPGGWRYTVNESIYSALSNVPFDGGVPVYRLLAPDAAERPRVRATIFGRTCDSADCLANDVEIPELRVGDRLAIADMGAYTVVSGSEFNGFAGPRRIYEAL